MSRLQHRRAMRAPVGVIATLAMIWPVGPAWAEPPFDLPKGFTSQASPVSPSSVSGPRGTPGSHDWNRPPRLRPLAERVVEEGQALSVVVDAADPDGDPLTISARRLPAGATLLRGALTWTPAPGKAGVYEMAVMASDGRFVVEQPLRITVVPPVSDANHPPGLIVPAPQTVREGELVAATIVATDPDDHRVQLEPVSVPERAVALRISPQIVVLRWIPAEADVGKHVARFRAVDARGESVAGAVTITVERRNRPPVIQSLDAPAATAGKPFRLTVRAVDPDGDAIHLQALRLPEGATLDERQDGTAMVRWIPDAAQAGKHLLVVQATDAHGQRSQRRVVVTVKTAAKSPPKPASAGSQKQAAAKKPNRPPVVTVAQNPSIHAGKLATVAIKAIDPDGGPVRVYVAGLPQGATLQLTAPGLTIFKWTPSPTHAGAHTMQVQATDTAGATVSRSLTITVVP